MPTVLWQKKIDLVQHLQTFGNYLLFSAASEWQLVNISTGTKLQSTGSFRDAKFSDGKVLALHIESKDHFRIQAFQMSPWKRVVDVPATGEAAIGDIVDDYLFFTDEDGVKRYRISTGTTEETRAIGWTNNVGSLRATSNRVYVEVNGHEVYGLDPFKLSDGWRYYCDTNVMYADRIGFVGTGTCGYAVAIINPSANNVAEGRVGKFDYYRYPRVIPAVSDKLVILGSLHYTDRPRSAYDPNGGVFEISNYLFALNRSDGQIVWKVPMMAAYNWDSYSASQVFVGKVLATFGGNKISGELRWNLQLRNVQTGQLLWKSKPINTNYDDQLASSGNNLLVYNDGTLTNYRIKS